MIGLLLTTVTFMAQTTTGGVPAGSRTVDATIFTIGPKGYTKARDGRNGFTCLISRQHRDMLEPECFDAEGTATVVFRFAVCSSRFAVWCAVWFASQFRSLQFAVRSLVRGSRFAVQVRGSPSRLAPQASRLAPQASRLAPRASRFAPRESTRLFGDGARPFGSERYRRIVGVKKAR
jgi:hypothetical protein